MSVIAVQNEVNVGDHDGWRPNLFKQVHLGGVGPYIHVDSLAAPVLQKITNLVRVRKAVSVCEEPHHAVPAWIVGISLLRVEGSLLWRQVPIGNGIGEPLHRELSREGLQATLTNTCNFAIGQTCAMVCTNEVTPKHLDGTTLLTRFKTMIAVEFGTNLLLRSLETPSATSCGNEDPLHYAASSQV